jgi:hypothetical protein
MGDMGERKKRVESREEPDPGKLSLHGSDGDSGGKASRPYWHGIPPTNRQGWNPPAKLSHPEG